MMKEVNLNETVKNDHLDLKYLLVILVYLFAIKQSNEKRIFTKLEAKQ